MLTVTTRTTRTTRTTTNSEAPGRRARRVAVLIVLLGATSVQAATGAPCATDGRFVMGTVLETRVCGNVGPKVTEEAFATAQRFDETFTTWADDGPVLRLNRANGAAMRDVPPSLRAILVEAAAYGRTTGGAFDVSVGPLLELWSKAARDGAPPSPAEITRARAKVGAERIEFLDDGAVRLPAGMAIDLGGIAKGFALDQMASDLRAAGVESAFLDFGQSSLLAMGAPPDATAWSLWLRRPNGPIVGSISLRDRAASVSATYGHSFEVAGRRYSHVVDPRSGLPIEEERLAVVVASDASRAEALSTALIVLGEGGLPLLERLPGVEALLVRGPRGTLSKTSGFEAATDFSPARPGGPPGAPSGSAQKIAPDGSSPSSSRP